MNTSIDTMTLRTTLEPVPALPPSVIAAARSTLARCDALDLAEMLGIDDLSPLEEK